MPERRKILVFIDWYLPGYRAGGPIRSISAMTRLLGSDIDFYILCSDHDFGESIAYSRIQYGVWNQLSPGGEKVRYLRNEEKTETVLAEILKQEKFDAYYFNSIFSDAFTLRPLRYLRRHVPEARILLAPRGMLGEGALKIKALKKKIFFAVSKTFGWFDKVTFHASSAQEEKEIRAVFGQKVQVKIALNLSLPAASSLRKQKKPNELNLFFFSRISPKKNLLEAIRLLKKIPERFQIRFSVYGPAEDAAYMDLCRKEAASLPAHITCSFPGALEAHRIAEVLSGEHVLFLPTRHENFGHAVADALSAGCPVVISRNTPWRNLEKHEAGFDIPLHDDDAMLEAITRFAAMNEDELNRWSLAARNFVAAQINTPGLLDDNRKLFS